MLQRVLEPEVMDTERDALEYQAIDNDEVNRDFVRSVDELCPSSGTLLDVGTGPGDITVLLGLKFPGLRIVAIDLAEHMLALARRNVADAGLDARVEVRRLDAKTTGYPDNRFDMVVSNSTVHHIPEPLEIFKEVARVARSGAGIFIKDLLRPSSRSELEVLVDRHASSCSDCQRMLFSNSLHAALTVDEVRAFCREAGLDGCRIQQCSDRHWTVERRYTDEGTLP